MQLLKHPDVEIIKSVHYRQYDTYFLFGDDSKGRVRYREDERLDEKGEVRVGAQPPDLHHADQRARVSFDDSAFAFALHRRRQPITAFLPRIFPPAERARTAKGSAALASCTIRACCFTSMWIG